jgi:predicted HTH transcriptional regulator
MEGDRVGQNDSLDFFPQHMSPRNILDDVDNASTNSFSNNQRNHINSSHSEDRIDSLRLVRSRSNSSNYSNTGYLFLAVVFCMMCCSSIMITPGSVLKMTAETTQSFQKIINGGVPTFEVTSNRKLMSASS